MEELAALSIQTHFGVLDWAIVIAFLLISTVLGVWAMRYIKDMEDYVVAGRGVRTYLGVASMIAAEMGLVTVMYSAQKGFLSAFAFFSVAVLSAIAGLVVGCTGFIVVPLRRMQVMTIPEFYEKRFSRGVRLMGGTILAASGILNMGMFLKADSIFVTSVMGMNSDTSLKIAMSVMLGLVLLYTMLGGMISVVLTDYMQFAVMAIGLLVTSLLLMGRYPWAGLIDSVAQLKGEAGFNPLMPSSGLGITYLVWMFFLGFIGACVWQTSVMRATSSEDTTVVRRTYSWGSVGFLIRFLIPYFWGVVALVYIAQDPQLNGIFLSPEGLKDSNLSLRAMPVAMSRLIPSGLIGLLTAGMLAAAMSTYNTYLHTWSAVLTQDVIAPLTGNQLSSKTRILIARILMGVIAVFLLIWGLWYPLGEALWDYMAVTGSVYFVGAFAILTLGLYWKGASRAGAYGALMCGFLTIVGLSPIQKPLLNALGLSISGSDFTAYVGLGAAGLALVVMVVLSLAFPDRKREG